MGIAGPHRQHVRLGRAEPSRAAAGLKEGDEAAPGSRFVQRQEHSPTM